MKLILFIFIVVTSIGCATNPQVEVFPSASRMSEAKAREIAGEYAISRGWQIKHVWNQSVYIPKQGEWEVHIDVVGSGCPYTFYVNDKTRATRAVTIGLP